MMKPDVFEGDASNLQERVIWVVRHFAGKPPRYKHLEDQFGISARKWQNMCNHVQQPSIEMMAALATAYPHFSEWLLTGQVSSGWQTNPMPKEPGELDLSVLDDHDEIMETVEKEKSELSAEDLDNLVKAFFSQLSKTKRRKNSAK